MTNRKTNVLFMQSQAYFGADSMIHSLLMRYLDRDAYTVHAAVNRGSEHEDSKSLRTLAKIPDLHIRPTHFGPTTHFRSKAQVMRDTLVTAPPMLLSLSGLVQYVREHKIDIIHGTEKPRDAFYGLMLARLTGAKMVVHVHVGVDLRWMKPLTQQRAMHEADALIGVSDFVAHTIKRAGFAPDKVYGILNALDLSDWGPTDPTKLRREFGISSDTPVMLIVSRINPYKGHEILLNALAQIKAQHNYSNFKLVVVGEDDPRSTPGGISYTGVMRKQIAELGLEDQVLFTGYRSDIRDLMAGSDMYTMPSHEEPFGVVYVEAGAMRIPVVSLNNGGTPEVVLHGVTGLLSNPGDVDTLAANIYRLLRDPALRRSMGEAGRKRVDEVLTPQNMTHQVEHVYQRLMQARG